MGRPANAVFVGEMLLDEKLLQGESFVVGWERMDSCGDVDVGKTHGRY